MKPSFPFLEEKVSSLTQMSRLFRSDLLYSQYKFFMSFAKYIPKQYILLKIRKACNTNHHTSKYVSHQDCYIISGNVKYIKLISYFNNTLQKWNKDSKLGSKGNEHIPNQTIVSVVRWLV